jgi:hypothetical protein
MTFLVTADCHPDADPGPYLEEENRRVKELTKAQVVKHFF